MAKLYFKYGAMGSSKTAQALITKFNYEERGMRVWLIKPSIDTRDGADIIRSRIGLEAHANIILPEDNIGTLYDRLMEIGSHLVTRTVDKLAEGNYTTIEQMHINEAMLKPAPKIFKEDCKIDWSWDGERIVNFVRGLSPYPAAWSRMYKEGQEVGSAKIFNVRFERANHERTAGEVRTDGRTTLEVACKDGWISLDEVQLAGKRRMAIRDLLLGLRDAADYCFTAK